MAEKEALENQLYERMQQENEEFLADMKTRPADEIIHNAYEIASRENLLMLFEDETSLTPRQLETLLEFEHPLAELYDDWINRDTEEMDRFKDSVISCANDILDNRAEETYKDPAQPMYGKSRNESFSHDEYPEWKANHWRNVECARVFRKDASNAYHDQVFPAFLQKWENDFGKERCMFVLACTMGQRTGDGRFYPPARQAAARFAAQLELAGARAANYAVDAHSCIVNSAMEHFVRSERGKAQGQDMIHKKKTQIER